MQEQTYMCLYVKVYVFLSVCLCLDLIEKNLQRINTFIKVKKRYCFNIMLLYCCVFF